MAGIYIHIPFCKSRCTYCAFYSTTDLTLRTAYADALCREIDARCSALSVAEPHTLYFGGGTPSLMRLEDIGRVLSHITSFGLQFKECTIECNPEDITDDYAMALHSLGFDRVSLGVQTLFDVRLRQLNRRHNALKVSDAIKALHKAGITNISIDLIYGLPDETLEEWDADLNRALSMLESEETSFTHLSAYCLSYEDGTPLYRQLHSGIVKETDEEQELSMYTLLRKRMSEVGFEHYEISNFARPRYRSLHNSGYWNGTHYIGIGAAAHSYDGKRRSWNLSDLKRYLQAWGRGANLPDVTGQELLSAEDHYNELLMTRLRTSDGLDEKLIDRSFLAYFKTQVQSFLDNGDMEYDGITYLISEKALFVSDSIIATLFL